MSLSCSSPPQSAVLAFPASPTFDSKQSQHLEHSTSAGTLCDTVPNTPVSSRQAPPTPPDSDSSSRNNTLTSSTSFSSSQPNHSLSPSQNFIVSSPNSSHSNTISMSTNHVVTRPNNPSLKLQENGTASSYNLSTAVSSNSREVLFYLTSYPTGLQFSYDHMFPDSSDSQSSLSPEMPSQGLPSASRASHRTPNVYINGLPPHFPEQELFALTRPFGEVKSVRSFTRHVSEKPTGYGFVLFSDVDSAEKCIEGLRKYRNLHPSFSKQIHRIPGTVYAQQSPSQIEHDEDSFKARMEKLKDGLSTNLYIEGLPLSIDEESLAALVHPYTIKSSRFFKTKLSEPPRIIAFVRLETRTAAEDTIERLHGRMVRGWNDPGCRISVRFADSAEQRELRRSERVTKNGDQSPARLTIAQAALLNLRGQELQAHARKAQVNRVRDIPIIGQLRDEISLSSVHHSYPNLNLASVSAGSIPVSTSLPGHLGYRYDFSPSTRYQDLSSNPYTDDLLHSLQQNLNLADAYTVPTLDQEHDAQRAHLQALASATLYTASAQPSIQQHRSQIQARNGFTPAEELILQAHARIREQQYQHLQKQQQFVDPRDSTLPRRVHSSGRIESGSKLNANAQVFHAPEQIAAYPLTGRALGGASRSKFLGDSLPPISEDDFHALGQQQPESGSYYEHLRTHYQEELHFRGDAGNVGMTKPPSRAIEIVAPPQHLDSKCSPLQSHHRSQFSSRSHLSLRQQAQAASTLPRSPLASHSSQHSYQHTDSRSNNLNSTLTTSSTNDKSDRSPQNYLHSPQASQSRSDDQEDHRHNSTSVSSKAYVPAQKSPSLAQQLSFDNDMRSPTLVSPALTYSSRTPSTLSPATPFFGSFGGSPETFEYTPDDGEMVEKVKVGSGTH
ncbi:hypothetical protein DEU56DRAFT_885894 [Suillus clintonianus]|uniref:uncharacterized protein n=1 Tax=Suillus clintonianus TaxID=1904413 RepID=UPI001B86CF08|nr:uncharacterized protein DEU56DRAFT_885894 [Suillus clintonianus]KAG2140694.1 hypothetical protein DEU56DRAFT_885894 [Suillus clintonianus]